MNELHLHEQGLKQPRPNKRGTKRAGGDRSCPLTPRPPQGRPGWTLSPTNLVELHQHFGLSLNPPKDQDLGGEATSKD